LDASFGGARLFGLLVNGAQAEAEGDAQHDQHGHRDAQTLEGRSEIGVGACSEIDGDAHG